MTTPAPEVAARPTGPDDAALDALLRAARAPSPAGLALSLGARLVQARLGLADPPTVDRYVVARKLGEGGAGAVFLATDPRLDRPVAIKVLAPREGDGRGARGLGVEEARALARLAHPNVVVVHDVGEQDGQVWLAMEYVAGGTLREWRARNPDAGWFEVARHALGAARGLAAAHDKGLVHRDFKPDNVMVGDDGRARVADFGLALSDGQAPASGLVEGTPSYLPPEVLAGAPPSALGDQYSFCASLRELLVAGQGAPSEAAPASPPDRPPWPEALSALVARGLAADPAARWPTMNAVVERLEALVLAPPDPRRDALIARVRGIWLDGVQATALLGADPVPLDVVAVPEAVEHASPAASTRRGRRTTATLAHELTRAYGALLLLGGPGAGKTTALLGLARELLERAERDPTAPVPVVLNLASAAGARGTLAAWVADELVTKYGLPRRRALQWLDDDALVLLLDGLDEVPAARRRAVAQRVNAYRAAHPTAVVVACRDATWAALGVRLVAGLALRIEAPSEAALDALCAPAGAAWRALAAPDAPRPTPLEVSLWLRATTTSDAATTEAPAASPGYDAFIAQALARPPRLDAPRRARVLAGLAWLAATMARVGTSDLWLERLQADWLPTPGQRRAAKALGVALLAAIALAWNAVVTELAGRRAIVGPILAGATVALAIALNRGLAIRPRERLRWSPRASLRRAPFLLASGLVAGLVIGALYIVWVNLVLCTLGALALAVAVGLEPRDAATRIRPAQGLRQSLTTALTVAAGTGLLAGLAVGYLGVSLVMPHVGPESTLLHLPDPRLSLFLSAGGFAALVAGLVYGGTAVTLHLAVRLVIAARSPLPLRLGAWLDRAADRGLMRRVGGGWMFLHRTLLDHLARRAEAPPQAAPGPDA